MKTSDNNISRKDFIKSSALAMAGLTLLPDIMTASPFFEHQNPLAKGKLSLKNVRLETGFEYEDNDVVSTKTALFYVEVENGTITKIAPNQPNAKAIDAKGFLMLPAFKDMHIHLDKTFYGDKWQAVRKRTGGVKAMIELQQHYGTYFARTHFNIDPTSGLQSLEHLEQALNNKKESFTTQSF